MTLAFTLPIETPRLRIRRVERRDLPALLAVNDDETVNRYLPYPQWRSLDDARAWLDRMKTLQADGSAVQLVLARRDDDLAIGTALVFRHDAVARQAELGYVLGRAHWGAGTMTEALAALLDAVFREAAVDRLDAVIDPANVASLRTVRRLGFRRDSFDPVTGTERLRLLAAAWRARLRLECESADADDVPALIAELDAYLAARYPAESNHGLDLDALRRPDVLFIGARAPDGALQGCGALVLHADWAEIKRMYVRPAHRGDGLGHALLARLEAEGRARGVRRFRLETGIHQPAALGLYERAGYVRRPPFADYREDPLSVFMEKPAPSPA